MAKLLEKIVNNRLTWFIEKSKILSNRQSGFQKHKSTLDNLIIINSEIHKAFNTKQYLGLISLDISKAYDSAWRHRILIILSKIISNGNMLKYIKNFLSSRKFMVKISKTLSNTFVQYNGVPQGSSTSVTLFLLAINDINETISYPISSSLFADDFNFWCKSEKLSSIQQAFKKRPTNSVYGPKKQDSNFLVKNLNALFLLKKRT